MNFDIVIIGAGPTGLSLALSLQGYGLSVAVIEKQAKQSLAEPQYDGREIALTYLSRTLMQKNGSWQRIDAEHICELQAAKVIDGNSPYTLDFETNNADALGFMISNHRIRKAVFKQFITCEQLTLIDGAEVIQLGSDQNGAYLKLSNGDEVQAQLMVAADTRFSSTRQKMGISTDMYDFGRSAVLCAMEHEGSHHNIALECFLYGSTIAVLPMTGKRCSVVITVDSKEATRLLSMDEASFNKDVEQRLGGRLGEMQQTGKRHHYPLVGVHANRFYAERFALIGDAAVGMHPVTAHGFNLGLSGQDLLARQIITAHEKSQPYWTDTVLRRYQQQHMPNTRMLYHGTNQIVSLFTNDRWQAKLARKALLRLSDHIPPIKWAIRHKLMSKSHPFSLFSP